MNLQDQNVLVTGASGFVGSALSHALDSAGVRVKGLVRQPEDVVGRLPSRMKLVKCSDLLDFEGWDDALQSVTTVVHLAARVHVMNEQEADPLPVYRAINRDLTVRIARAAVRCKVKRFVYVSTIKVNGERTGGKPFAPADAARPLDPYGVSKYEAEEQLREIARETGLELVIVRPVLVYGPGVGGNFLRLIKLVERGIPLPLGSVSNQRSMIALGNLVDLLLRCIGHEHAPGHVFLAADGEDLSTPGLIRQIAVGLNRKARLVPLPPRLLSALAGLVGKAAEVDRLIGSLQVDTDDLQRVLDWRPPLSPAEGINDTLRWYRQTKRP